MQSNGSRPRPATSAMDGLGNHLRSQPANSPLNPMNALPPSLTVRQPSVLDPRNQYIPGPPPGGPPVQLAGGGGLINLPPPPPRPVTAGAQGQMQHPFIPPPPPPGPPPTAQTPSTPWSQQQWPRTQMLPPPPPVPNVTAYNPVYSNYTNNPSRQTSSQGRPSNPMEITASDQGPMTSATYVPSHNTYGLGVGVPPLEYGSAGRNQSQQQDAASAATASNSTSASAPGSAAIPSMTKWDPLPDLPMASPPQPSENDLPPSYSDDGARFRSAAEEKAQQRRREPAGSIGSVNDMSLHSDGNTPVGRMRENSRSRVIVDDAEAQWPLERVLTWMAANRFSEDWQEVFRSLELSGSQFLELGVGSGGRGNFRLLHNVVYPSLVDRCAQKGTEWDQAKEQEEGRRLRRLIRSEVEASSFDDLSTRLRSSSATGSSLATPASSGPHRSPKLGTPEISYTERVSPVTDSFQNIPGSPTASFTSAGNQARGGPYRTYRPPSNEPARSAVRSQASREALSGAPLSLAHSPHPSSDSSYVFPMANVYSEDGSNLGSPARYSMQSAGSAQPLSSSFDHQKNSPSIDSTASSHRNDHRRRATGGEGPRPPPVDTTRHASDGPLSAHKDHKSLRSIFGLKKNKHSEDHPDSPNSPTTSFRQSLLPFHTKFNSSDTTLSDRPSSVTSIPEQEKTITQLPPPLRRSPTDKKFIFTTIDGYNYRLVNVTDEDSAAGLKSLICRAWNIQDVQGTQIFLTEAGQGTEETEQPLGNAELLHAKRTKGDPFGSLKILVKSTRPIASASSTPSLPSASSLAPRDQQSLSQTGFAKPDERPELMPSHGQPTPPMTLDSSALDKIKKQAEAQQEAIRTNPTISSSEREASMKALISNYNEELIRLKQAAQAAIANKEARIAKEKEATLSNGRPVSIMARRTVNFDDRRESPYENNSLKSENPAFAPQRSAPAAPSRESATLKHLNSVSRRTGDPGSSSSSSSSAPLSPGKLHRQGAVSNHASSSINSVLAGKGITANNGPRLDLEIPHGDLSPLVQAERLERDQDSWEASFANAGRSPDEALSTQNTPPHVTNRVRIASPASTSNTVSPERNKSRHGPLDRIMKAVNTNNNNNENSPPTRNASVASHRSFGPMFEVEDNVQFEKTLKAQQQQQQQQQQQSGNADDDDDDDSDDGLFARPIKSTTSPTTPRPRPPAQKTRNNNMVNRRKSIIETSKVWANRPPVEALIEDLDAYFPDVNLDDPVIEANEGSPPASPSQAVPPLPPTPDFVKKGGDANGMSSKAMPLPMMPAAIPEEPGAASNEAEEATIRPDRQSVARRSVRKSELGRMKSIREVARQSTINMKRQTTLRSSYVQGKPTSDLLRRRSTKMFGHNIVQVTPRVIPTMGRGSRMSLIDAAQAQPKSSKQTTFTILRGRLIGKGTYGRVYLGINANTGEVLAIKQVEVSKSTGRDKERTKELVDALDREIDTMKDLDHPNIVQYLGSERGELSISIFLEYIEGGSIGSCLRRHGKFEERVVRDLTRQVLDGLSYLHEAGILHRDLKADNILLNTDGTCKISDFGISKRSDNIYGADVNNTMQGSVFWMAPEVVRSQGQGYGAKVDIWSLGCVVLEMFAGRRPWGREEAIGAIYKLGTLNEAPPIPEDVSKRIAPEASAFMWDCFTIDPDERPRAQHLRDEHPFCRPDEFYNFMNTELYDKLKNIKEFNSRG